ncbi:MAG: hypothetical protein LBG92_10830 [Prevotellaceae bacterium]|nr:hypothetical protein [Prevotellaceae bacterium]
MANIRNLKKDIAYLTDEIITDAQLYKYMNPDKNVELADSIIIEAVDMCNQLCSRVNNPDGKDNPKLVKQHYKAIQKDLLEKSHELFDRISKLNK